MYFQPFAKGLATPNQPFHGLISGTTCDATSEGQQP